MMVSTSCTPRRDPFAADYDAAIQLSEAEEPSASAPVPGSRFSLAFEPRLVPENTPMAALDGLQTAMREGEARLAEALGDEAEMVVLDGPPIEAWFLREAS